MKTCNDCRKQIGVQNKSGFCKICYSRNYRKKNKEKIRPVTRAKYLRKKDYFKEQTKKWKEENRERYNEVTRRLYRKNSKEWNIRERTRYHYGDLKKESSCELCGSEERLEFHHERPYDVHKFVILCFKCHRNLHGQLFTKEQADEFIKIVENRRKVPISKQRSKE